MFARVSRVLHVAVHVPVHITLCLVTDTDTVHTRAHKAGVAVMLGWRPLVCTNREGAHVIAITRCRTALHRHSNRARLHEPQPNRPLERAGINNLAPLHDFELFLIAQTAGRVTHALHQRAPVRWANVPRHFGRSAGLAGISPAQQS